MTEIPDPLVVYVPNPMLGPAIDVERLRALNAGTDVLIGPTYEIAHARRVEREKAPFAQETRDAEPLLTAEQLAAFARAHVVFALDVPMDLPSIAPNLRWVQAMGSGVGQYVSSRLPDGGITLTNSAGIGAAPIAEWVVARILQILKRLPTHDANAREQRWVATGGTTLEGKTIAIVGLGAIGRAVARLSRAFGVHTIGLRRTAAAGDGDPDVDELFPAAALHDVLRRADIAVLCAPGTESNHGLFDKATFAAMKEGSIFVNVSRGVLVDEPALIGALESHHLRAAAIDVARLEPLPADDPLWSAPNLLISPHSSASIDTYAQRAFALFIENFERFVNGHPLRNVVDMSSGY